MKRDKLKNQKGAISLFVMLSMMFFLMFMLGAYTIVNRRNQSQVQATTKLRSLYSSNASNLKEKYAAKFASNDEVIPISNYTELCLYGTGKSFERDGKIYTCDTGKQYQLTSDIVIDIDKEVVDGKFKFYDYLMYGTSPSIDKSCYDILYYKENAFWKCMVYQNTSGTNGLFNSSNWKNSNLQNSFSKLEELNTNTSKYKKYNRDTGATGGDNFEFLLMYDMSTSNKVFKASEYKLWFQSFNPLSTNENAVNSSNVKIIKKPSSDNKNFNGMALANLGGSTYLNGDLAGTWYNAVCVSGVWSGGIPAGNDTAAAQCVLFVRVN